MQSIVNPWCVVEGVPQACPSTATVMDLSVSYLASIAEWAVPAVLAVAVTLVISAGVTVGFMLSGSGR